MTDAIRTFRDVWRVMKGTDMTYSVEFKTADGEVKTIKYHECASAGVAFAKCQQENPGATMLHATAKGVHPYGGRTDYEPPPVQRDPIKEPRRYRAPKRDERDGVMPFYDEVLSEKPWT